jgi:hypothetical protein
MSMEDAMRFTLIAGITGTPTLPEAVDVNWPMTSTILRRSHMK